MDQLRKAGKFLLDQDEKYAYAADRQNMPMISQLGHAVPLRQAINMVEDPAAVLGGKADTSIKGKVMRGTANAAITGAQVASRYALPAGGLTLAGTALLDLTNAFGSAADTPEPNQLSL